MKKYIFIFLALIGILCIISFWNSKRVQNQEIKIQDETFEDTNVIAQESDLTKLETPFQTPTQETLQSALTRFAMTIAETTSIDVQELNFDLLPEEEVLSYTNAILSNGEKVCYTKTFIQSQSYKLFARDLATIPSSTDYSLLDNKICFSDVFLNDTGLELQSYTPQPTGTIEIILKNQMTNQTLQFLFVPHLTSYSLKEVHIA